MTVCGAEPHLVIEWSNSDVFGPDLASMSGELSLIECDLLNGIQKVVVVPCPSSDVKLIPPFIKSTS